MGSPEPPKTTQNPEIRYVTVSVVGTGSMLAHGMALEFVNRAENRYKSSGVFPKPPRGRVGPGSGPKSTMSGPPPPKENNLKTLLTALELRLLTTWLSVMVTGPLRKQVSIRRTLLGGVLEEF